VNELRQRTAGDVEDRLREICHTDAGPYLRPFAPNPEWRTAQVFVVGTNPATPLRDEFESFDAYWRGLTVDPSIFERVNPHTLVVHGAEAVALAQDAVRVTLDVSAALDAPAVTVPGRQTRVYAFPHFSGMGAPRGFAVGRMDAALADVAARIRMSG